MRGMGALLLVTLIWGFSFGIIGKALKDIDPLFVGTVRLLAAAVCFIPFLKLRGIPGRQIFELGALGALQFGLMYICYLSAFQYLEAWQVALFSVLTPLWVATIDAAIRHRFAWRFFAAAGLSVLGAAIIRIAEGDQGQFFTGFLLMQLSNLAFAGGQIWFREWKFRNPGITEKEVFGLLYLGALVLIIATGLILGSYAPLPQVSPGQWTVLLYLGIVASGVGFFLWNYGASRVSAGFLAASNNLVVPLGVLVAILLNKSEPNWGTLSAGSALIVGGLIVGCKRETQVERTQESRKP